MDDYTQECPDGDMISANDVYSSGVKHELIFVQDLLHQAGRGTVSKCDCLRASVQIDSDSYGTDVVNIHSAVWPVFVVSPMRGASKGSLAICWGMLSTTNTCLLLILCTDMSHEHKPDQKYLRCMRVLSTSPHTLLYSVLLPIRGHEPRRPPGDCVILS